MNSNVILANVARVAAPIAAISCVFATLATPSMAQTPKPVNARIQHQDARIKAAVKSHQISHAQAHKLIAKENKIKHTVAVERAKNGGHLTAAEHAKAEHHLDKVSKDINKDKATH